MTSNFSAVVWFEYAASREVIKSTVWTVMLAGMQRLATGWRVVEESFIVAT